ncbi:MAG: YlxR family protein [Chloroflexi bacterium]|nr:YlxR family protein [Chloroflexota bacterium]
MACRSRRPQSEFVRLVRGKEGGILISPPREVPGRGVYLCRDQKCWVEGIEKGRIARAIRSSVAAKDAAAIIAWARNSLGSPDSDTAK